jgi:hypothetical protein
MRFWHKSVSVGVLAIFLLLPFASLAMCAPQSAGAMHCPDGCPMMAKLRARQQSELQLSAEQSSSCCDISSSKPQPATTSVVVSPTISILVPAAEVERLAVRPVHAADVIDSSPPCLAASQSQLCTFRI